MSPRRRTQASGRESARAATTRRSSAASRLALYLGLSKAPVHSLLAVAPLVLLHATLVAIFRPPVMAAAAGWVYRPFRWLGLDSLETALVLTGCFIVAGVLLSARDLRSRRVRLAPVIVPLIWLEGALWGLVLDLAWNGFAVAPGAGDPGLRMLEAGVGPPESVLPPSLGPGDSLTLALGAGIYEELVFRVGLYTLVLGLLGWRARRRLAAASRAGGEPARASDGTPPSRRIAAVLVTSLAFALAHHFGDEAITARAVVFRTVAAFYLTTLYAARGLGVAVTAHATYDAVVETAWAGAA